MSTKIRIGLPKPKVWANLATVLRQEHMVEQAAESEDETEPESPEQHELDNVGVSDISLQGEEGETWFDQEWTDALPLLWQLPRYARPPVLYWIDPQFAVHPLFRGSKAVSTLQNAIAHAIATHLKNEGVGLSRPGDWQHIPAIGSRAKLTALAPEEHRETVEYWLNKRPGMLQSFALVLPDGDVVAPEALMDAATERRRASRAGVLRATAGWHPLSTPSTGSPLQIAGERWTKSDLQSFKKSQKQSMERSRKSTKKQRR